VAELLGPHARQAGPVPRLSIFNLGEAHDYRIPDGGLLRERTNRVYAPTAALVVEIVSPDDESWNKLPFYAAHHVDEVLIVDPQQRSTDWLALDTDTGAYHATQHSALINLGPAALAEQIDWP
jgi:Uma2 family endonuclease